MPHLLLAVLLEECEEQEKSFVGRRDDESLFQGRVGRLALFVVNAHVERLSLKTISETVNVDESSFTS